MRRSQHYQRRGELSNVDGPTLRQVVATVSAVHQVDRALTPILTLRHLAQLTGVPYGFLRQIAERSAEKPYKVFRLQKRDPSRYRTICVPENRLRIVQQWIVRNILQHRSPHDASAAYARGCTVRGAAEPHCGARWLIKVDVTSFFESISEKAVYRVFRESGYQPLVSLELARICTYVFERRAFGPDERWRPTNVYLNGVAAYFHRVLGSLPQGAPTSPMLSNLAVVGLDENLEDLASQFGLVYTRYADDLTFSTIAREFGRAQASRLISRVYDKLEGYRLAPNRAKTKVIPPGARKVVLGLLVDGEKPRLTRDFRANMRMHVFFLKKLGAARHAAKREFHSVGNLRDHLFGLVAFANQVEPELAANWKAELDAIVWPDLE